MAPRWWYLRRGVPLRALLTWFAAALALALAVATPAFAADAEETAILAQVDRLFAAMKSQDKATLDSLMSPDGMMTILTPKGV